MTSPKTWANLIYAFEQVFPARHDTPAVAKHFNMPVGTVQRNRTHFDTRLTRQQACATFHAAPSLWEFLADRHNLRLLTGEFCLHAYIENTIRHAEAETLRQPGRMLTGGAHMADAAHRHHVAHDPRSATAGRDKTIEGALLDLARGVQIARASDSGRAGLAAAPAAKFIDFAAPLAFKAARIADGVDIENPDPFQRAVGDFTGGSAPFLAAAEVHPAAGAFVAALQGADRAYEDARAHGASVEGAEDAALTAGPTDGLLMLVPGERLLDSFVPHAAGAALRTARELGTGLAPTGATMAAMQVNENLVARSIYDPDRPPFEGAVRSGLEGMAFAGVIKAGRHAIDSPAPAAPRNDVRRALDATVEAIRETTLPQRAPETARALMEKLAPHTDIVIPTRTVTEHLATAPMEWRSRFLELPSVREQLDADPDGQDGIRVSTPDYLAVVSDTASGAHEAFSSRLTMVPREPPPAPSLEVTPAGSATETAAPVQAQSVQDPASPPIASDATRAADDVTVADTGGTVPGSPPGGITARASEPPATPIFQPGLNPWSDVLKGLPPDALRQASVEIARWRWRELFGDVGITLRLQRRGATPPETGDHLRSATEQASTNPADINPGPGVLFVVENRGAAKTEATRQARIYEAGTAGNVSNLDTGEGWVPALLYENPNPRGRPYVKFDGYRVLPDGRVEVIDAKTRVLVFRSRRGLKVAPKVEAQLLRQEAALKQNPSYVGIIEVPNAMRAQEARAAMRRLGIGRIEVRVRP